MKQLTLLLVIFIPSLLFSQIQDKERATQFWGDNVRAIVDQDVEKILRQTNFPLDIARSESIESMPVHEAWTKAKFKAKMSEVFTKDLLADFGRKDYTFIDAWEYDDGMTYMVIHSTREEGIVFSFKQYDGLWKLYQISYSKD